MENDEAQNIVNNIEHIHRFQFDHFNGGESVFICMIEGCNEMCSEPEDCGTGA